MPRKHTDEKRMVYKVAIMGRRDDQWSIIWRGKAIPFRSWDDASFFATETRDEDMYIFWSTPDWMHPRELFPAEAAHA